MDKKRSFLNVTISISFKIILLIVSLFTRKFLIKYCGNDINGLNSLFLSMIGILSVAELGIGTAITFSMYKPIVEGDHKKVSALYHLFKRLYTKISIVIFVGGLISMLFLKYLAKDYEVTYITYIYYFIMLVSSVLSYFFLAKTALINAHKNNYITTTISSTGNILLKVAQVIVLILFGSFVLYLLARVVEVICQWIVTNIITKNKYHGIMLDKQELDIDSTQAVKKNIAAVFMNKLGTALSSTSDSLIISAFIGVEILGRYANYTLIVTSLAGVLVLFFTPLTSVIGHFYEKRSKQEVKRYFNVFYLFNFILGMVFYLGFYAVIDEVISILFSSNLVLDKDVVMVITINYFINFMRQSAISFRFATGSFYNDRYRPFIVGIINIILSIIFVNWFGITGAIVATIITNVLITHIVEPYFLFKCAFNEAVTSHCIKSYFLMGVFVLSLFIYDKVNVVQLDNLYLQFLVNGFISVGISLIPIILIYIFAVSFRKSLNNLIATTFKKITSIIKTRHIRKRL